MYGGKVMCIGIGSYVVKLYGIKKVIWGYTDSKKLHISYYLCGYGKVIDIAVVMIHRKKTQRWIQKNPKK